MAINQDIQRLEGVERVLGLAIRYASRQAAALDDCWAGQTVDEAVGSMQTAQAYVRADILRIEREGREPRSEWKRTLAAAEQRFWEGR